MFSEPVLLDKGHDTSAFDCGKRPLNAFLQRYALSNQAGGSSRTYVSLERARVVGYYSLAPASVEPAAAPERVLKGQPRHHVPCVLLARMGVYLSVQGQGLGRSLFRDAMLRALAAADIIGGRAFLVHAKDEDARQFYMKYGMEPSPIDPLHLFLLFKDVRAQLDRL